MTEANIKIFVRPVQGTFGSAQHIYIIKTNSKNKKEILRAGTEYDEPGSMLTDNLKVVYADYIEENEKLFPNDWKPENAVEIYSLTGLDAEIQAKMDTMWAIGQQINGGKYDYKVPFPIKGINIADTIWHVQNSNTAGSLMAKSIGVDLKPILLAKKLWAPGVDGRLDHTIMDKSIKTYIENRAGLSKYGEYTEEEFKALGLDIVLENNKEKSQNYKEEKQAKLLAEYAKFEQLMQDLKLDWNLIVAEYNKVEVPASLPANEYGLGETYTIKPKEEPKITEEKTDTKLEDIKVVDLGSTRVSMHIVKYLTDGKIAVMWSKHTDQIGADMETYLELRDKEGNNLKGPIHLPIKSHYTKLEPLSNGNFIIYTKDTMNIFNPDADLLDTIKLDFLKDDAYQISLRAMPDNRFLLNFHDRAENNTAIFKGRYFNNEGQAIGAEFNIYHRTVPGCKTTNIENNTIGIICVDQARKNSENIGQDHLTCTNNAPETTHCFSVLSTLSLEKSPWIKIPIGRSLNAPDMLNFGNNNFVVAIDKPLQKVYTALVSMKAIPVIKEIVNSIKSQNEIHLTKIGCNEFLLSSRSSNAILGQKYNLNGEMIDSFLISDKTAGSKHHHITDSYSLGYVINWMDTEHKHLPSWSHFEYGYSGAWSHFKDIATSIYMELQHLTPQVECAAVNQMDYL